MNSIVLFGALTLGALGSAGTAAADAIEVDGNYASLVDCQADGPRLQQTMTGGPYRHWNCQRGEDGLYYLFLGT